MNLIARPDALVVIVPTLLKPQAVPWHGPVEQTKKSWRVTLAPPFLMIQRVRTLDPCDSWNTVPTWPPEQVSALSSSKG